MQVMQVIKRDGTYEPVSFDKITKRISDLCYGLTHVDPLLVAKETINPIKMIYNIKFKRINTNI